jgi:mycofactocin precursor
MPLRQHREGTPMADSAIPGSETTSTEQASDTENFPVEETTDTMELDLELEEELIIEDFTIDGICGVY